MSTNISYDERYIISNKNTIFDDFTIASFARVGAVLMSVGFIIEHIYMLLSYSL